MRKHGFFHTEHVAEEVAGEKAYNEGHKSKSKGEVPARPAKYQAFFDRKKRCSVSMLEHQPRSCSPLINENVGLAAAVLVLDADADADLDLATQPSTKAHFKGC